MPARVPSSCRASKELDALAAHDEVEDVALGLAAKTVEEASILMHMERWRLLIVEGTEPLELTAAGRLERYNLTNYVDDVEAFTNTFFGVGGHRVAPIGGVG